MRRKVFEQGSHHGSITKHYMHRDAELDRRR